MSNPHELSQEPPQNYSGTPSSGPDAKTLAIAIVGGVVGAVVGYGVFRTLLNFGMYAAAIPGAFVGLGAGFKLKQRFVPIGIVACVMALIAGVLSDFERTVGHNGFMDYLTGQSVMTYIMLALGTACGFWFGVGRDQFYR